MKIYLETALTVLFIVAVIFGFIAWCINSEKGLVYRAAGYYPANTCTCCEGGK